MTWQVARLRRHFARRWVFQHLAADEAAYSAAWAAVSVPGGEQEEGLCRVTTAAAALQSTAAEAARRARSPPPVWARGGGVVQRLPLQRSLGHGNWASDVVGGEGCDHGGSQGNCGGESCSDGGRETEELEADSEGPAITSMHIFFGQAIVAQVVAFVGGDVRVERNGASMAETMGVLW